MPETIERGRKIESLKEYRRGSLSDAHVTDYDFVDPDTGCKMKEITVPGPQGTTNTVERNQTHLFQDAPSTTDDVDLLILEAEMVDEGKDLANPHIPSSEDKLESAKDRIEAKDLEPAWEQ